MVLWVSILRVYLQKSLHKKRIVCKLDDNLCAYVVESVDSEKGVKVAQNPI